MACYAVQRRKSRRATAVRTVPGSTGARSRLESDSVVLAAALVVVAVILTGGFTPRLGGTGADDDEPSETFDDRTFN